MYFEDKIKELYKDEEVNIFVDMDGVIASYDLGEKLDFKNKRPLNTNINTLKQLSKNKNINMYILSICKLNSEIKDKNDWLDKYASFFHKNKRYIIPKEEYDKSSKELKMLTIKYLKEELKLTNMVLIDDDNGILKYLRDSGLDIKLFQDSSLLD